MKLKATHILTIRSSCGMIRKPSFRSNRNIKKWKTRYKNCRNDRETAIMLKAQENLSYEEIAAIMKTSASSVESLIFRARRKLMEILEK